MARLQEIPWLRIAAESIAIVMSILLAFAIDAWWSNWKTRQDVEENLSALEVELENNLSLIERELSYRQAVIASIELLGTTSSDERNLTPDEIDRLLGDMTWLGKSEFSTGALEATLQSGVFASIEDGELRRLLAALPALYEYVVQFELSDIDSTTDRFIPYINANGSFNQIASTTDRGRPGTGEMVMTTNYRVVEHRDHSQLLQSDEFLGLLTQEHWDHVNVQDALHRLKPDIEKAIALIDAQLP
jgi:hypothetical protein